MSLLKEDIQKMIDEYDKICRPLVVFINPEDAKLLREAFPRIEDEVMFRESLAVERGQCFAAKRKDLDNIMFGSTSPSISPDNTMFGSTSPIGGTDDE